MLLSHMSGIATSQLEKASCGQWRGKGGEEVIKEEKERKGMERKTKEGQKEKWGGGRGGEGRRKKERKKG